MKALSREHDEQILRWLHLSERGVSFYQIAADEGIGRGSVSRACRKIRDADMAQNPACAAKIATRYAR
jgi:DNA-binding transcriptional ArsR family regulator